MKVRRGSVYVFRASLWDIADRRMYTPVDGTVVRVCHPWGCPPPNTMGHAHIEYAETGEFIGLVSTNSLHPINA